MIVALAVVSIATIALATVVLIAQRGDPPAGPVPTISSDDAGGRRLWVLLFDVSSMQSEDVARAKISALRWIDSKMSAHDLVSVETAGVSLSLVQNFSADVERVRAAVDGIKAPPETSPDRGDDPDLQERDQFNNDLRFRELHAICTGLRTIGQKKAIVWFTATRERAGPDNQVEVRAATDACSQANTEIDPVDVRDTRGGGGLR